MCARQRQSVFLKRHDSKISVNRRPAFKPAASFSCQWGRLNQHQRKAHKRVGIGCIHLYRMKNPCAKCPCKLHGEISRARSVRASCMGKFPVREVSMQAAWGNFPCAKCPCKLHGEISRARSVRAVCMEKFPVREVSVQTAWGNFSCAKCPCMFSLLRI